MKKRGFLVAAATLGTLFVAGCAMGPDYQRPQTTLPEAFEQATDSGTSIANLNWYLLILVFPVFLSFLAVVHPLTRTVTSEQSLSPLLIYSSNHPIRSSTLSFS